MEERRTSRSRVLVSLKKGEEQPNNAIQLTETEILDIQNKRIQNFEPQSEVRIFKYGHHFLAVSVAASGLIINNIFRKNFRLGGLKIIFTYAPSTVLPALFTVAAHELTIKQKILLGQEPCPICVTLRSGFYQVCLGLFYPYVISLLSCLPVAREYYTLPMPTIQKGMGYLKLLRQVSPTTNILLGIGALNLLFGMEISRKEMHVYAKHFRKPPSPEDKLAPEDMINE